MASLPMNHVAISVTDLERAIDFYTNTFGFTVLRKERINTECTSTDAKIFRDIFKGLLKEVKVAWLKTGNGVGLELFEFINPKAEQHTDVFGSWLKHFSHISFTALDIDELCNKII